MLRIARYIIYPVHGDMPGWIPGRMGREMDGMNLDGLFKAMDDAMIRGARDYMLVRGRDPLAEQDALMAALNEVAPGARKQALADARQAFEAGMPGYAVPTAMATMTSAGIAAAKRVVGVA